MKVAALRPSVVSSKKYTGAEIDVVIPEDVLKIGRCAFIDTMIRSVKIPDSVVEIDGSAFSGCKISFSSDSLLFCRRILGIAMCSQLSKAKNSSDTAKGADASALCFSMIETAKRNHLDPFGYLMFLLQELPALGDKPTEERLRPLLPWSDTIPDYCQLGEKKPDGENVNQ